jgi:GAF domain-containing protein
MVEGHLWGAIGAGSLGDRSLPPDIEARLWDFTELVATAIANAESRAALAASRARIVAAADESRRQIERDLHDGAQQRLVHAVIVLKLALRAMSNGEAQRPATWPPRRCDTPSRRTPSCASWRTAFSPQPSPGEG